MGDSLQNRLPDPAFPASRSGMEWSDVIGESDPFGNGGGAGKTLRAIEWGRHRMGSPAAWPQSLCTILTLCLASPEPICILWGPARVCFYNDACISIIGEKHPWALGKTGAEIWPGLWEKAIQPLCDAVERNGKAVSGEKGRFPLNGLNQLECSLTPIRTESGQVDGVFIVIKEAARQLVDLQTVAQQKRALEILNRVGGTLAAELDLGKVVQTVTDAGCEVSGAAFGAFFYHVTNDQGQSYMLYVFSGAPKEAFREFGMPHNTPLFEVTFKGEAVVRIHDLFEDPRYGTREIRQRMEESETPMRSYLAVPVISRAGKVLGGLFFGHPEPGVFSEQTEKMVNGIAAQAAIAMDNARLYTKEQRTAERLRLALSAANLGDWFWDSATDLMTLSERAAAIFGVPVFPPTTRTKMRALLPEEDAERARQALHLAIQAQTDYDIEYRVNHPGGEQRWVAAKGRIVQAEAGKISGMLGVVQDITARKEAEKALRDARARLETTLVSAEIGTWTWDIEQDQMIGDINFARMFSVPQCDPPGGSIELYAKAIHPEDRPRVEEEVVACLVHPDKEYEIDYRLLMPDHTVRWVTARGKVERDEQGKAVRFPGVIIDITERKKAEAALKEAKEMAEAASRAKDRFLAVLSHELRTPLTPVLMTAAALETDPDFPSIFKADMTMIRRNVELETKLIDDLLDLSRITSGKLALRIETIDFNDLVRQVCGICRQHILEKGIRLECDLDEGTGHVAVDPARLQQVLWNVLKNAVKFTPEKGVISVTTRRAQSGEVRLEVRDNGIGIAPDLLTRIFEAFEQGDPRITQQFGGLGLGLAISRALVELHKGRIFAQSDGRGNGATFTIELPAHSPEQTPPSGMPPAAQPPGGGPLRVLIVEDHLDTARTLARLLARLGFFVKTATTVAGAVQLAGEEHFDIVVSDLGLPDATGYDLIRTLQKSHPIRGIAMSGYGMEEDIRRSLEAGFSEHLVKPLNVPQLEQAIRRIAPDRAAV